MSRLLTIACAACCSLTPALAGAADVPPSMRAVLRATYMVRDLTAVDLSPRGDAVAWQESFRDPRRPLQSPRWSAVYVAGLDGSHAKQL
ncbi:MAG: hypothetical protein JO030_05775, partial [Candidatus Eremiobacteraeota bacterium]|nr:hypothetical protein [Candidatus Eremiobacteraeota bacterium]